MIRNLEELMYQMSDFFMAPVLILLAILFGYSLMALGGFFWQAKQRRQNRSNYHEALDQNGEGDLKGYPLVTLKRTNPKVSQDELDVAALEEMEGVRMVSRLAPMLGLIATMVPMGPALKSLADGNVQGISDNLIVAFSAVIFGLVIASITFWIASVKKRWLAAELVAISSRVEKLNAANDEGSLREAA